MRFVALLLFLILLPSGLVFSDEPVVAFGESHASNREICWSEPPNLDGFLMNSEVISQYGIDIEVANDLVLDLDTSIILARWWGGYYGYVPGDPLVDSFNLLFYADDNCIPANLLYEFIIPHECGQTFIYDGAGPLIYEYFAGEADDICCPVSGGQRIWFTAQAADHLWPPQWSRLAADQVTGCYAVFRSEYHSFPEWITIEEVIEIEYDASQEFECGDCGGVASESTSWGRLKGLYR